MSTKNHETLPTISLRGSLGNGFLINSSIHCSCPLYNSVSLSIAYRRFVSAGQPCPQINLLFCVFHLTCPDIDECKTEGGHFGNYCGKNTRCVNTPGSYRCDCLEGHSRVNSNECSGTKNAGTSARSSGPRSAHVPPLLQSSPQAWGRWLLLIGTLLYLTRRGQ